MLLKKPAAATLAEVEQLVDLAQRRRLHLVEDYGYLFDRRVALLRDEVGAGGLGDLVDVEVAIAVPIIGPGSSFAERRRTPSFGGAPGRRDRRLHPAPDVDRPCLRRGARRGADPLAQPVPGAEPRLRRAPRHDQGSARDGDGVVQRPQPARLLPRARRGHGGAGRGGPLRALAPPVATPKPSTPHGEHERRRPRSGRRSRDDGSLARRLGAGPGLYEGVWALVRDFYEAQRTGREPTITSAQVRAVNELTFAILKKQAPA